MKKMLILLTMVAFLGCAAEEATVIKPDIKPPTKAVTPVAKAVKPDPKVQVKLNPSVIYPTPVQVVKESREVLHFYTFRSDPPGAGVYVVDGQTGKEVGFLGTTPVRILLLKKKLDIEGNHVTCTGLVPNAAGLTLAGKSGKVELVEFQFKFKMQGYNDDIKVERLSVNSTENTDMACTMALSPVRSGR